MGPLIRWLPMRTLIFLAAVLTVVLSTGCRRASPSDVGAAERASAFPMAEMKIAAHANDVSPQSVAPAAKGTAMREATVGGVPPVAASHSQP